VEKLKIFICGFISVELGGCLAHGRPFHRDTNWN